MTPKAESSNAMWTKRPRGQIAKCATAQALRSAFPEIASQYTAEEMEGKDIQSDDGDVLDMPQHLGLTAPRAKILRAAARAAIEKFNVGDELGAYEEMEPFTHDNDELQAAWKVLTNHSSLRAALKRISMELAAAKTAFEKTRDAELNGDPTA